MTQPYPAQYAPQPQYAPAPHPQPAGGGQGIAPPVPQLRDGGGSGGGAASPKLRHLIGRTIVVVPKRVDEQAKDLNGQPRPEAYFDLIVVDGGPLQYGDNQDRNPANQRPNAWEINTPCVFYNANDYGQAFVIACRDALAGGEPGRVGVVQYGTRGNKPPLITKTSTDVYDNARPNGQQLFDAGMAQFGVYWTAKHNGPAFPNPEPRSLVAAAPAGPPVNYGAPAAQPQPVQTYTGSYPGTYPPAYAAPATSTTTAVAPSGYYMPQAAPQSAPPAAAPAAELPGPVAAWIASFPPEQQEQQRAAYLAQMAGQAPAAGPGF